jgi:hypothetical protein
MKRDDIEKAANAKANDAADNGWWRQVDVLDFAIQQINAALEEAAKLAHEEQSGFAAGGRDLPVNALDEFAYRIRTLKIK